MKTNFLLLIFLCIGNMLCAQELIPLNACEVEIKEVVPLRNHLLCWQKTLEKIYPNQLKKLINTLIKKSF